MSLSLVPGPARSVASSSLFGAREALARRALRNRKSVKIHVFVHRVTPVTDTAVLPTLAGHYLVDDGIIYKGLENARV